jgi:hypothetical protein
VLTFTFKEMYHDPLGAQFYIRYRFSVSFGVDCLFWPMNVQLLQHHLIKRYFSSNESHLCQKNQLTLFAWTYF